MRKLILLILISFIKFDNIYSQDIPDIEYLVVSTIGSSALSDFDNSNFESAIKKFELILPLVKELYGPNDTSAYEAKLTLLAFCYENIKKYDKALYYYKEEFDLLNRVDTISKKYYWNLRNISDLLFLIENYQEAIFYLRKRIDYYSNHYNNNDFEYATLVFNLSQAYSFCNQFVQACNYLKKSQEIIGKIEGLDSYNYGSSFLILGNYYFNMSDFDNAIKNYNLAIPIIKKKKGENSVEYIYTLDQLASSYFNSENYKIAEEHFLQVKKLRENIDEKIHKNYGKTLNDLTLLYIKIFQYNMAEKYALESIEFAKKEFGVTNNNYAISLENLARIYCGFGNYKMADSLYQEVLIIRTKIFGIKSNEYAESLHNIANLYTDMSYYQKSEEIFLEILKIKGEIFQFDSIEYINILNDFAYLYEKMGQFKKAEDILTSILNSIENSSNLKNIDYEASINNLAILYMEMNSYKKAELLCIKEMNICKKKYGENDPSYANSLNTYANLLVKTGKYNDAELYYEKSAYIIKNIYGIKNYKYAIVLNNLGVFYMTIKQYEKAHDSFLKAKEIYEKNFSVKNSEFVNVIDNISDLYLLNGNIKRDETIFYESVNLNKNLYGEMNLNYVRAISRLAYFESFINKIDSSIILNEKAITIQKKLFIEDNEYLSTSYNNLALIYSKIFMYEKSDSLFKLSLNIKKNTLGENHPDYTITLDNIIDLNLRMGKFQDAIKNMQKASYNHNLQIRNSFSFLSQTELEYYIAENEINNHMYYSYALSLKSIIPLLFDNLLNKKGMILNSSLVIQQKVNNSNNAKLTSLYSKYVNLKSQLSQLYVLPIEKRWANTDSLEKNVETTEKQLAREVSNMDIDLFPYDSLYILKIKRKLNPNEIILEFVSFCYFNGKRFTDSVYYCAFIFKKNMMSPEMIFLCEEGQLNNLMGKNQGNNQFLEQLYKSRGAGLLDSLVNRQNLDNSELYNLIWKPLKPYLDSVTTVYFSPSGLLHQISFAAIPTDSSHCLADKYDLHQLSSTRELVINRPERKTGDFCLFGGIDYTADSTVLIKANKSNQSLYASRSFTRDTTFTGNQLQYLKGTQIEVEGIQKQLIKSNFSSTIFTGFNATEESFKALNGKSPRVIHIASHGFFYPDLNEKPMEDRFIIMGEDRFKYSPNPLLRSGLMFAGANHAWNGESVNDKLEDGILTAYEISQMDLYGTDLVVLSACETGMGEIRGSEGVFGLQRAFKMAGVKTIVMSLWKVPDTQTSELMKTFYENWMKGQSKHQAFVNAQKTIRLKYPNPYYWAGFVMVD